MDFEQFLSEAFGAQKVPYGTNPEANNGQVQKAFGRLITDMIYKDQHFRIGYDLDDGTVSFVNRTNGQNEINPTRGSKTGLEFYNRIGYVIFELLDHAKAKTFRFEGESHDLKQLYSKIVANSSFQRTLKQHGWRYDGEKYDGLYLFSKGSK